MRKVLLLIFLSAPTTAQAVESWLLQLDRWDNASFMTLHLQEEGGKLSGTLDGDHLSGTRKNGQFHLRFITTDGSVTSRKVVRMLTVCKAARTSRTRTTLNRAPVIPSALAACGNDGPARHSVHEFKPKDYANEFTATRMPVLTVWLGDTVHTTTIDSGAVDESGVTRALYGNPQTGPFFVVGAEAGRTLAVHLIKLKLNRAYADSLDAIVARAQSTGLAARATALGKPVRWKLDFARGLASPERPGNGLSSFALPVRPMLGGLAVAPPDGPAVSTGDTGRFGGNMDFNEVIEGNTVYLPVQQPGALLYLVDAHALQGDGESSQYALETSTDVEFRGELIKGKAIAMPRVEPPTNIMTLGQAGSLDIALPAANAGMVQWLEQDYGLIYQTVQ